MLRSGERPIGRYDAGAACFDSRGGAGVGDLQDRDAAISYRAKGRSGGRAGSLSRFTAA